jgi:hypothetical protein
MGTYRSDRGFRALIGWIEQTDADRQLGAGDAAVVNHVLARRDQGANAGRHFSDTAMEIERRVEQRVAGDSVCNVPLGSKKAF